MKYEGEKRVAYGIWAIGSLDSGTIKEETDGVWRLALPLAKSIHELLQSGCALDLEEHLVVVVRDFDVQVLRWSVSFRLLLRAGAGVSF